MFADPLGYIGLRRHHALTQRTVPAELKILFFAIGRIGDGTDGQDDFNHSLVSFAFKASFQGSTPNWSACFNFGGILSSAPPMVPTSVAKSAGQQQPWARLLRDIKIARCIFMP